jgi:hypothetical protein
MNSSQLKKFHTFRVLSFRHGILRLRDSPRANPDMHQNHVRQVEKMNGNILPRQILTGQMKDKIDV